MYWTVTLILLASIASGLSPDHSDYESINLEDTGKGSQSLTKELLNLDLGYNVLNSEVLRKSLVASAEVTGVASDSAEALPQAAPLVQQRSFQVHGGHGAVNEFGPTSNSGVNSWPQSAASTNSDEKFWAGGPSPFFFPDFGFGRPRQVSASAVRPFRRPKPEVVHRKRNQSPAPKAFVGDQHQCGTGSCEFFLFCWLSGGRMEGSCGGFLFACCLRPDGGGRNSEAIAEKDKARRPEVNYGPVRNDPRCGLNAASRSVAQRRIVGGSEAGFGSFPWQAYIRIGTIYTQLTGNRVKQVVEFQKLRNLDCPLP